MNKDISILLADDDPDILEILEYNLTKEGYTVYTSIDGAIAIELANQHYPDVMILDVMMPKISGVDVCAELREKKEFQDTIIAFLTARDDDFSQITCYEAGGDDFMSKPITPKVLLSRIKALTKRLRNKETPNTQIQVSDLTIDKDAIEVRKGDEVINLVKKEFELLLLLTSKPGKVFRRSEISEALWSDDVIVGDRTIDVHIRKLREKLGSDYISTVTGMGYKFND